MAAGLVALFFGLVVMLNLKKMTFTDKVVSVSVPVSVCPSLAVCGSVFFSRSLAVFSRFCHCLALFALSLSRSDVEK
jgi:hypothetical protein